MGALPPAALPHSKPPLKHPRLHPHPHICSRSISSVHIELLAICDGSSAAHDNSMTPMVVLELWWCYNTYRGRLHDLPLQLPNRVDYVYMS